MDTRSGQIGTMEEMQEKFGKDNPNIVPIPATKIDPMSNWGKRKRMRYAELLEDGVSTDNAFDFVENNKGLSHEGK